MWKTIRLWRCPSSMGLVTYTEAWQGLFPFLPWEVKARWLCVKYWHPPTGASVLYIPALRTVESIFLLLISHQSIFLTIVSSMEKYKILKSLKHLKFVPLFSKRIANVISIELIKNSTITLYTHFRYWLPKHRLHSVFYIIDIYQNLSKLDIL